MAVELILVFPDGFIPALFHVEKKFFEFWCPGLIRMVLNDSVQFTENVGTADCMCHIRILPVGAPAVMDNDSPRVRKNVCSIHTDTSAFFVNAQIRVIPVRCIMDPPCFSIDTGTGLITVDQPQRCSFLPDFFVGSLQWIRTAGYHVLDRAGCKWDVKYTGQDFMCAVDTDRAHCIKSNNHCLEIFSILHGCPYTGGKRAGSGATMHGTLRYWNQIMGSDIHSDNGVYFMACFFDTGFRQACIMIRTSITVGMHMILRMVRFWNNG